MSHCVRGSIFVITLLYTIQCYVVLWYSHSDDMCMEFLVSQSCGMLPDQDADN